MRHVATSPNWDTTSTPSGTCAPGAKRATTRTGSSGSPALINSASAGSMTNRAAWSVSWRSGSSLGLRRFALRVPDRDPGRPGDHGLTAVADVADLDGQMVVVVSGLDRVLRVVLALEFLLIAEPLELERNAAEALPAARIGLERVPHLERRGRNDLDHGGVARRLRERGHDRKHRSGHTAAVGAGRPRAARAGTHR